MRTPSIFRSAMLPALLVLAAVFCADSVFADPPARVARLGLIQGEVSFAPAGDDDWRAASLNRPLISGDRLYTDRDARAELDIGAATVRLDERSSFSILGLDDSVAQLELTQGTLNLRVHRLYDDQRYEVNTPTLALVIDEPGEYRIDIDARGNAARVTVFDGAGEVFGAGGARYRVDADRSYHFADNRLRDVAVQDLPRPDDFDDWCFARDERYDNARSHRYVSDEMIGGADLDDYGVWDNAPSYGTVWYPARVASGWAPYRDGHWAWIDPWGWTWVDDAPWGFAPFHYGRWVYVGNRWGWLPGPVALRPVYAPALVVFIGGSNWQAGYARGGAPVGWCPLGPRDVYVPPYSVSRGYYTYLNSGLDRNRVSRSYEDYAQGRPVRDNDYAYRHNPAAVTAVSHETFVRARPVGKGRLHLKDEQLKHAEISADSAVSPSRASRAPARDKTLGAIPRESFKRKVIKQNTPPAPAEFTARPGAVERKGGRSSTEPEASQRSNRSHDTTQPRRAPVTTNTDTGNDTETENVVPRDRSRGKPVERTHDPRQPPPDDVVPQSQPTPRTERRMNDERSRPAARYIAPHESARDTRQVIIEPVPEIRAVTPPPPAANDRSASQINAARMDELRRQHARATVPERNRDAPVQTERRYAAPAPSEAVINQRVERNNRRPPREQAPPVTVQQAPVESAPQPQQQATEQQAPPQNQRSAAPARASEAGRERKEQRQRGRQATDDAAEPPGLTSRYSR